MGGEECGLREAASLPEERRSNRRTVSLVAATSRLSWCLEVDRKLRGWEAPWESRPARTCESQINARTGARGMVLTL